MFLKYFLLEKSLSSKVKKSNRFEKVVFSLSLSFFCLLFVLKEGKKTQTQSCGEGLGRRFFKRQSSFH